MGKERMKVAVLGPLGTYTHEAAFSIFGNDAIYEEQSTIAAVFNALSTKVPLGVVPQENSIFGNVIETYDQLRYANAGYIRGEVTLKVEHCLVVRRGVGLHQIRKVLSHEQALGQCRDFIADKLPGVTTIKTPSTAAAAQALLESGLDCAAICSSICVRLFEDLEILYTGIQNEKMNFTRFFILAHSTHISNPLPTEVCLRKALVRLSPPVPLDEGSQKRCQDIMQYLKALDLPAHRIDRRPSLQSLPFHDVYFIELDDNQREESRLPSLLESWTAEVEKAVARVHSLGAEVSVVGIW